jgi:hypothetical protein
VKKCLLVIFGLMVIRLSSPAAEAPCGVDKEAARILALAKSELGVYSAVITPHVAKIREKGGMDVATADAMFDRLAAQAKKDGYDLRNIVSELKTFNRLVVGCKEYPEYLKRLQAEKERAARAREAKRQADLALQKQKEEEERVAKLEAERLEREREAQRRIELENERRKQEEERAARLASEFQKKVEEMASALSPGMVIRIPPNVNNDSLINVADRGRVGVFSKLVVSGDRYIVTIKDLRDLRDKGDDLDLLIRAVKKRKGYDITFIKKDFVNIKVLAATEKGYSQRR